MLQRTLAQEVSATGVGLHSGERVRLTLKPAAVNSGIVFCRTDLPEQPSVRVHPNLINDTRLSSTIVTETGLRIATIEHIMSAFAGLGIDNIKVELSAPEIPIMDGSSLPFIYLLESAGIVNQEQPKKFIRILKEVTVVEKDKEVHLSPYDGFKIRLNINFDHPVINRGNQTFEIDFKNTSYLDEIARARTFGFMQEIEFMRSHNLGLGGNLNNAIVIDEGDVLNPDGLRFDDEFVRHKILDAIGDLYVIGHPIIGFFEGIKSGHAINNKLLRALLDQPDSFEYVSFEANEQVPNSFHELPKIA
ncbi:UDP-3-O-acyl-N-acetylglucosamine deacetylase [Neisseria sp. Ec49-e6-T10]|uniref:UDP-3-O-acyl-N-acetylglucosamine deacetylase n=1 Tax=Neisseria sp. Ec49-e6-T10 TaxID=3140744 RepID=UPI003EB853D9